MQRDWIRTQREGAEVDFRSSARRRPAAWGGGGGVFTTRPDTPLRRHVTWSVAPRSIRARSGRSRRPSFGQSVRTGSRRTPRPSAPQERPLESAPPSDEGEGRGVFTGALRRSTRSTASAIPIYAPTTCSGLRHRRDHGRAGARRARLRVREEVSTCRSSQVVSPTERSREGSTSLPSRHRGSRGEFRRPAHARVPSGASSHLERGHRHAAGEIQTTRLGVRAPALLGRADPDLFPGQDRRRSRAGAPVDIDYSQPIPLDEASCRSRYPSSRTTTRRIRGSAGASAGLALLPEGRALVRARDEHDAAVGGLVLVLPALPRSRRTTGLVARP
jgi:hypothetical protein